MRPWRLGIEGITVSPGYSYNHAPRQDVFLGRSASKRLFREIFKRGASRAARRGSPLVVQSLRPVPGFPRRQSGLPVHALEQADLQHFRLAAALLSADRRGLRADASSRSWRIPTGRTTASAAIRAATTAWRIAASRAPRWTMRLAHPIKALQAALRGPQLTGPDGARAADPLRRSRAHGTVATVPVAAIKRVEPRARCGRAADR